MVVLAAFGCHSSVSYSQGQSGTTYQSGYFLGNSLTWNGSPQYIDEAFGSERSPEIGWAIYPGWPLHRIATDASIPLPSIEGTALDSDYVPYAIPTSGRTYQGSEHFQKAWEFISIQPHYADYDSELAAAIALIRESQSLNPGNAEADLFLYQIWPFGAAKRTKSYVDTWLNSGRGLKGVSLQYFKDFQAALEAEFPNQDVFTIPIGEVLAELDRRLTANPITLDSLVYASAWDLFEDDVHLSDYGVGSSAPGEYVAHMTMLASIWGGKPEDYSTFYHGKIDDSYKILVDTIIEDTVAKYRS